MSLIDWILNVAGVFLWIDWRSAWSDRPHSILSIASTLRRAGRRPPRGFGSLAAVLFILLVRPLFYYTVGAAQNWVPTLEVLEISIPWRSDLLGRMFLFSTLSFCIALGYYYAWLLLLSAAHPKPQDEDVMHRFLRAQLGLLERVPRWIKPLVPSLIAGLVWAGLAKILINFGMLPEAKSSEAVWGQGLAMSIAATLAWKWFLPGLFMLHMLNTYVYLGTHPVWPFISATARRLLWPFSFLRFGKVDLSPLAGAAAVIALVQLLVEPFAVQLFRRFVL